jgi:hypothetical protein
LRGECCRSWSEWIYLIDSHILLDLNLSKV